MMRLPFFRRKHQRLNADSDDKDDVPELTRRASDESSGSESAQSFDPNHYTVDECISAVEDLPVANNGLAGSVDIPSVDVSTIGGPISSRRQWLIHRKAHIPVEEPPKASSRNKSNRSAINQGNEPAEVTFNTRISAEFMDDRPEIDQVLSLLRSSMTESEKTTSSTKESKRKTNAIDMKANRDYRMAWNKSKESYKQRAANEDLEDMLRADTWVRRVSSLEACFRKESERKKKVVDEKALESVIMKVISFGSDDRKPKSRESSVNSALTDDVDLLDDPSESLPVASAIVSNQRNKKEVEQHVKPRFTTRMGKVTANDRGIRNRVPEWSDTSSGEIYTVTTSDDETTVSGNRQRRRRTWSPEHRSVSSIDDDDFSDSHFLGGCNPSQPCAAVSSELRLLFSEVLTRDGSFLSCMKSPTESKLRKSKK